MRFSVTAIFISRSWLSNAYNTKINCPFTFVHLVECEVDCLIQCSPVGLLAEKWNGFRKFYGTTYDYGFILHRRTDGCIYTECVGMCYQKILKWTSSVLINFIYIILYPSNWTSTQPHASVYLSLFLILIWMCFHFIHFMNNTEKFEFVFSQNA